MSVIETSRIRFGKIVAVHSSKSATIQVGESIRTINKELPLDLSSYRRVCMVGVEQTLEWLPGNSDLIQAEVGDRIAFEIFVDDNKQETTGLWAPLHEYLHVLAVSTCTQRFVITLDGEEPWVGVYHKRLGRRVDIEGVFPLSLDKGHMITSINRGKPGRPKRLRDNEGLYYRLRNAEVLPPNKQQRTLTGGR